MMAPTEPSLSVSKLKVPAAIRDFSFGAWRKEAPTTRGGLGLRQFWRLAAPDRTPSLHDQPVTRMGRSCGLLAANF